MTHKCPRRLLSQEEARIVCHTPSQLSVCILTITFLLDFIGKHIQCVLPENQCRKTDDLLLQGKVIFPTQISRMATTGLNNLSNPGPNTFGVPRTRMDNQSITMSPVPMAR
jgi:hypothetical protein